MEILMMTRGKSALIKISYATVFSLSDNILLIGIENNNGK